MSDKKDIKVIHTGCYTRTAYEVITRMLSKEVNHWRTTAPFGCPITTNSIWPWESNNFLWQVMHFSKYEDEIKTDAVIAADGEIVIALDYTHSPVPSSILTTQKLLNALDRTYKRNYFRNGHTEHNVEYVVGIGLMKKAITGELTAKHLSNPLFKKFVGKPFTPFTQAIFAEKLKRFNEFCLSSVPEKVGYEGHIHPELAEKMHKGFEDILNCLSNLEP